MVNGNALVGKNDAKEERQRRVGAKHRERGREALRARTEKRKEGREGPRKGKS